MCWASIINLGAEAGPVCLRLLLLPTHSHVHCRYPPCQGIPGSQLYTCKDTFSTAQKRLLYSAISLSMANLEYICEHSHLSCFHSSQALQPYHLPSKAAQTNQIYAAGRLSCSRALLWHSYLHRTPGHTSNWTADCGNNKIMHYPIWFLWLKGFPNLPCLLLPSSHLGICVNWATKLICCCGEQGMDRSAEWCKAPLTFSYAYTTPQFHSC